MRPIAATIHMEAAAAVAAQPASALEASIVDAAVGRLQSPNASSDRVTVTRASVRGVSPTTEMLLSAAHPSTAPAAGATGRPMSSNSRAKALEHMQGEPSHNLVRYETDLANRPDFLGEDREALHMAQRLKSWQEPPMGGRLSGSSVGASPLPPAPAAEGGEVRESLGAIKEESSASLAHTQNSAANLPAAAPAAAAAVSAAPPARAPAGAAGPQGASDRTKSGRDASTSPGPRGGGAWADSRAISFEDDLENMFTEMPVDLQWRFMALHQRRISKGKMRPPLVPNCLSFIHQSLVQTIGPIFRIPGESARLLSTAAWYREAFRPPLLTLLPNRNPPAGLSILLDFIKSGGLARYIEPPLDLGVLCDDKQASCLARARRIPCPREGSEAAAADLDPQRQAALLCLDPPMTCLCLRPL